MAATTHFYMVLGELPPRCRELLRHVSAQPQPFSWNDRVLPPCGVAAWAGAFQLLCSSEALERVGWGPAPRFQIKPSARRALVWYAASAGA